MVLVRSVAVVVPARDEADLIGGCLRTVLTAANAARSLGYDVSVLVVADRCTDQTAAIARAAGAGVVVVDHGSVGTARAAGIDAVLGAWRGRAPETVWIASTDADSRVSPSWLLTQLEQAELGAEAFIGTVGLDAGAIDPLTHERWNAQYVRGGAHAGPRRHGHVHGANLGIRADVYLEAGGYPPLRVHEDRELVRLLVAGRRRLVWSMDDAVITAPRSLGRVPGGVSADISALGPARSAGSGEQVDEEVGI